MDEKLQLKQIRKTFSAVGWALVVYLLIMNAAVTVVVFCDMMMQSLRLILTSGGQITAEAMQQLTDSVLNNGWGYLLSIAIGYFFLRIWKGKHFCGRVIWQQGKPMGAGDLFCLVCFMLSSQVIFQIFATMLEFIFNLFGMSVLSSVESASANVSTLSMLLYMGLGAPVAEELLFRGLVLRTLEPYGKRFAIVMSAFLFGIFHGNIVQIPFAFCVGLVFGYVAVEHSIGWAMLLHMINNLVLGDSLMRLVSLLPELAGNLIVGAILIGTFLAALGIAIVRRKDIGAYFKANPMDGRSVKAFFTAPGIITLMVAILFTVALTFAVQ